MKNLKNIILCAGIILTGLLAACSNPLTESANEPAIYTGSGNVLIRIAGSNGRTILPTADGFSRYELEVTKKDGTNITVPQDVSGISGNGVSMKLPEGEYTITVKAYRGNNLAAKGSKTETFAAGSKAIIDIDLRPFIGEGNGFFSYNITLPSDAITATLKLKSTKDSTEKDFNLKDSAVSSAPTELAAGYYELFITLTNSKDETGDYHAVHIYSGMETKAEINLSGAFSSIDLGALESLIAEAEAALAKLVDDSSISFSDDGEDITVGKQWVSQSAKTALESALSAAKAIVANPPNKQKPINQAQTTLASALTTFGPHYGTKDIVPLQQAILTAEDNKTDGAGAAVLVSDDGTNVRIVDYWVTQKMMDDLNAAITAANAVVADDSSKQSAVVAAQQKLEQAIAAFQPKLGTKDLRAISALIAVVENTIANTPIDDAANVWVGWQFDANQEPKDALTEVLNAAKAVVADDTSRQPAIVTALQALQAALDVFQNIPREYGTKFDNGDWKGNLNLLGYVDSPVKFTVNNAASSWTLTIPLLKNETVTGTYTVANGKVTFEKDGASYAIGNPSADYSITLNFTEAVRGADTLTLTKGAPSVADTASYLFSGIYMNAGDTPVVTYMSSDNWTFSSPSEQFKVNGSFNRYDQKAAFYKTDGELFAIGKLAQEKEEIVGNVVYIYTVDGKTYEATRNALNNPFISNWLGGETIPGTFYADITTWSLEDGGVVASGEYVYSGDTAKFISSDGTIYATGNVNAARTELEVTTTTGDTQVFTLVANPFKGNWSGSVLIVGSVKATVTENTYSIVASALGAVINTADGQYIWRVTGTTRTAYFYSNGYSYGKAVTTNTAFTNITVTPDEPIASPLGSVKTINLKK